MCHKKTNWNKTKSKLQHTDISVLKPRDWGGGSGSGVVSSRQLSQGHTSRTGRKTRPRPLPHPLTSRPGHRTAAFAATKLPFCINKNVLSSPLSSLFFPFRGRKEKLPSVSQNRRWKHFRSNPEQSSKTEKKGKKEKEKAAPHEAHAGLQRFPLCYVGVHFTVLRCSRQVFSLNQSFNPLLDHHRTRKKSCPQLLRDLQGEPVEGD